MNDILLLIALFGTVVFLIMNTYYYFVPYWEAEAKLYADNLRLATQKAVVTSVLVEMVEDNDWEEDRPTVVATPKNNKSLTASKS
jgi:hypothetical protein